MWERYGRRRQASGGIQARSRRGDFGETWWGRRWMETLESFGLDSRLARGRSYARAGQVLTLTLEPGLIRASVQGSAPRPYAIAMKLPQLPPVAWERVGAALAQEPGLAAQLLNGELPSEVEAVLARIGISLFPRNLHELSMDCRCPDYAIPCKHLAAVCCLLAEELDRDPFGLFLLRGKTRDALLEPLLGTAPPELSAPSEPLPTDPARFWHGLPASLPTLGPVEPPPLSAPVIRRLGPFPLWRVETPLFEALAPVLDAATRKLAEDA